jgi:hypothetical protein
MYGHAARPALVQARAATETGRHLLQSSATARHRRTGPAHGPLPCFCCATSCGRCHGGQRRRPAHRHTPLPLTRASRLPVPPFAGFSPRQWADDGSRSPSRAILDGSFNQAQRMIAGHLRRYGRVGKQADIPLRVRPFCFIGESGRRARVMRPRGVIVLVLRGYSVQNSHNHETILCAFGFFRHNGHGAGTKHLS